MNPYYRASFLVAVFITPGLPQVSLSNSTLNGPYFVRHVEFTTDANNTVTDARSILGSITFDGAGSYSFSGQQLIGSGTPLSFSANGAYSVSPAGIVTLTNPQNSALTINARYGTEMVIGSSTDASASTFDMFVAIPAPSQVQLLAHPHTTITDEILSGYYPMIDFELTNASTADVRVALLAPNFNGAGSMADVGVAGHAASISNGDPQIGQKYTGTYTVNSGNEGSLGFQISSGASASTALLGTATRNLYVSASGNVLLAGTPGAHDILIGLANSGTGTINLNGRYWIDGIRVDSLGASEDYVGATTASGSIDLLNNTDRTHEAPALISGAPTLLNFTTSTLFGVLDVDHKNAIVGDYEGSINYFGSAFVVVGNDNTIILVHPGFNNVEENSDTNGFEIAVGVGIPSLTGTGVFLNPQGIVNAATYAPIGDYVSPGEFVQLYGSGLAPPDSSASAMGLPFPPALNGVSVSFNGAPAPLFNVQPGEITCIVPYELTGTTATVQVNNNGALSNIVTVGAAPTSPGVISANSFAYADGAITHTDETSVNSSSPAQIGETVQMYVIGLGGLTTPVIDGNGFTGIDEATVKPTVWIDNIPAPIIYWGLTEDAGLYQIDVTIPPGTPAGEQSIAILSGSALTETTTIYVQ